jgi:hypothetical protein
MTRVGHEDNTVDVKLKLLAHKFYIFVSLRLILPFVITQVAYIVRSGINNTPQIP